MVTRSTLWICGLLLAGLAACGPGLRDGAYVGEPRFTLAGTIENILEDPSQGPQSLRVTVLWQMVAPPADSQSTTASSPSSTPEAGNASPANPDGVGSAPTTPEPPYQPTVTGQQGGAVNVAFPAPVSLVLYDTPLISQNVVPWQAEGTVVIYYDLDGDGQYDAGSESIAATLQDYRLLYTRDSSAATDFYVDSILDNPEATQLQFTLATRRCDGLVEHLVGVANTHVSLTPGVPTACADP